ncbi:MAG TPA: hypothetical protein VMZ53_11285 [Kofleriaceae bacterium]|nr:hypothetical protein [Kofleriaceae bacterium]
MRLSAVLVCAFVAQCIVFGVRARTGGVVASYQVPFAVAGTWAGCVLGAAIAKPRERGGTVWLVLALGAIELGLFALFMTVATWVGFSPFVPIVVGVMGGAILFVVLVSDLQQWQFGVAAAGSIGTVVIASQPSVPDFGDVEFVLLFVAISMVGGMLGRTLRSRIKTRSELPPAQLRK